METTGVINVHNHISGSDELEMLFSLMNTSVNQLESMNILCNVHLLAS